MVKVYAMGMGPLPLEKPRFIHGSCVRTWHFVKGMLEQGHEVCLVASRVNENNSTQEQPPFQKTEKGKLTYYLADEVSKYDDPAFHRAIFDEFKPDVIAAITTIGCRPIPFLPQGPPLWADIHGYVMGEAQLQSEYHRSDGMVYRFWRRYDEALRRADCFSVTSNIQRHTLIGELGAVGRLNQYTAGYEFVYSIPLAHEAAEIRKTRDILRGKAIPQDAFVLLWLGGYNLWCDVETLFSAVETAMSRNERIHYVSTGGAIDGVSEVAYKRLLELVEKSRHRSRYHFQGWVDSADVPNYLLEANAGINVDRPCYEAVYGARHRITEMIHAGIPVITTLLTEISREVVRAGAGLGSPPQLSGPLAENILQAADHTGQTLEMGIIGRQLFLEKYTDKITLSPFIEWLKDPQHAPDWGKEIPWRENLLYDRLLARPFKQKVRDFLRNEYIRWKKRK